VTISTEKIILQKKKAVGDRLFIHAHFIWDLRLGLGLRRDVITVRIRE